MLEKDKKFQKGDPKMTQISRAGPNQDTNTKGPSRNVSTSNATSINLNPRTMKKPRRARKRCKIKIYPDMQFPNLRPATLIPNKRIRSRATFTIMINRDRAMAIMKRCKSVMIGYQ